MVRTRLALDTASAKLQGHRALALTRKKEGDNTRSTPATYKYTSVHVHIYTGQEVKVRERGAPPRPKRIEARLSRYGIQQIRIKDLSGKISAFPREFPDPIYRISSKRPWGAYRGVREIRINDLSGKISAFAREFPDPIYRISSKRRGHPGGAPRGERN